MNQLLPFLQKIADAIDRLEPLFPPDNQNINFNESSAFRWEKKSYSTFGTLAPIMHPASINFEQLKGIDRQISLIKNNTEQFLNNFPANNILLTGSRGTGKSSIVKAVLKTYHHHNLKMIEIDNNDLNDLPDLLEILENQPHYFIIFCDDLSFEANDPSYKPLKAMLDGSLSSPASNILLYATSNRRHLLPESMQDNLNQYDAGEIHPQEAIEEKISLSERFGLWVSFYPYSQSEYLTIVKSWINEFDPNILYTEQLERDALQFSQTRGSRSGRIAYQFSKDYIGRYYMNNIQKD
ncbi:ATP-binding protein [Ignatzschineria sp. LJL83]